MKSSEERRALVSGASMAGLSAAYWLGRAGYKVTVVEQAGAPRTSGAAVDLRGPAIDLVKQMGIYEPLKAAGLHVARIAFKNTDDSTAGAIELGGGGGDDEQEEGIEIERDQFVRIMLGLLQDDVEFCYHDSITALSEIEDGMSVTFRNCPQRSFGLVLGCDGMHSAVRRLWFGPEEDYVRFLGAYFSITTVNKLLVEAQTMQMYNVPGKAITFNAYNGKTDIILCFLSDQQIPYDHRDEAGQRQIMEAQFAGVGWRSAALLEELRQSPHFYFDQFCQVKMPSWTRGRVALAGDAAYCASPAAGMGASLALAGAAAVAEALQNHHGNIDSAFSEYNQSLRPFIEEVQAAAEFNVREHFIPRTEEAIRKRNMLTAAF